MLNAMKHVLGMRMQMQTPNGLRKAPALTAEEGRELERSLFKVFKTRERETRDLIAAVKMCRDVYMKERDASYCFDNTFPNDERHILGVGEAIVRLEESDDPEYDADYGDARDDALLTICVRALVHQYLVFMTLKWHEPGASFGPSALVDEAWHAHVLDTDAYAAFCERHFGEYVHHRPHVNDGQYERTAEGLKSHGLAVNAAFWPEDLVPYVEILKDAPSDREYDTSVESLYADLSVFRLVDEECEGCGCG